MPFRPKLSLTAIFRTYDESNLLSIYLTAWMIIVFKFIFVVAGGYGVSALESAFDNTMGLDATLEFYKNILIASLKIIITIMALLFNSLLLGFILETVRLEIKKVKFVMPLWEDNYIRFLFRGIVYMLILFFYSLPILIILGLSSLFTTGQIGLEHLNLNIDNLNLALIGSGCSLPLIIPLLIIYLAFLPVVTTTFAEEDDFWGAFDLFEIFDKIKSNLAYYVAALIFAILLVVAFMCISVLISLTCLGLLFIPLMMEFILPIIILNMYAQIHKMKTP